LQGFPVAYLFSAGTETIKQFRLGDLTYKVAAMAVDDINNDGANELVIAAGSQDKGKVFILKQKRQVHVFTGHTWKP